MAAMSLHKIGCQLHNAQGVRGRPRGSPALRRASLASNRAHWRARGASGDAEAVPSTGGAPPGSSGPTGGSGGGGGGDENGAGGNGSGGAGGAILAGKAVESLPAGDCGACIQPTSLSCCFPFPQPVWPV